MKEPPQYERVNLEEKTIPELVEVILRQQEWMQQMYKEIEARLQGMMAWLGNWWLVRKILQNYQTAWRGRSRF